MDFPNGVSSGSVRRHITFLPAASSSMVIASQLLISRIGVYTIFASIKLGTRACRVYVFLVLIKF